MGRGAALLSGAAAVGFCFLGLLSVSLVVVQQRHLQVILDLFQKAGDYYPQQQQQPRRITETPFFTQNVRLSTLNVTASLTTSKTIQDHAAYLLPPGQYGGPQIPCRRDEQHDHQWDTINTAKGPFILTEEDEITAIFTFSARYCNPDLRLFREVWRSHVQYMALFESMPKIFVLDGFGDVGGVTNNRQVAMAQLAQKENVSLDADRYQQFQSRLAEFMVEQNQTRVSIQKMPVNMGPVQLLSRVLPTVATPIIYLAQDDFALNVTIETGKVVRTMLNAAMGYNNVRYVLLAKDYPKSRMPVSFYGKKGESPPAKMPLTDAEVARVHPSHENYANRVSSIHYDSVCLDSNATRKVGFYSDNNHFALTELYTKFLLPWNRDQDHKFVEQGHQRTAMQVPHFWGRYYGSHQYTVNEQVLIHLDGRDLKWCQ